MSMAGKWTEEKLAAERERLAERAEAYAVFRGLSLKKLLVEEA